MSKLLASYGGAIILKIVEAFTNKYCTNGEDTWQSLDRICESLTHLQDKHNIRPFSTPNNKDPITLDDISSALNECKSEFYLEVDYKSEPSRARLTSIGMHRAMDFNDLLYNDKLFEVFEPEEPLETPLAESEI